MEKSASISDCGKYRWSLTRIWDETKRVLPFIMLNPSTADAEKDDPTIRRCIGFAYDNGYGGIIVLNLYSYRATNPKELFNVDDPIGHFNNSMLGFLIGGFDQVVCAWGTNAKPDRVKKVYHLLNDRVKLVCLGTTKNGSPRHPLYVKKDQPFVEWPETKIIQLKAPVEYVDIDVKMVGLDGEWNDVD